jgi:hypothetical protein
VPVTKPEEIFRNKEHLLENAKRLRILANDLNLARSTGQFGVADPHRRDAVSMIMKERLPTLATVGLVF